MIDEEEALVRAAVLEDSTKSKHATQLRAFDLLKQSGGMHKAVVRFIVDYVPNHAKTGAGAPRKASGLRNALGALLAGLAARDDWKPTSEQRLEYRRLERGVLKLHADSTELSKAKPVLVGHLRRVKHHLPLMEGSVAERRRIGDLWNGYALLVLMLQGVFRRADVGEIRLEKVKAKRMKVGSAWVNYYVVSIQDKPRKGTPEWRHVVIVDRDDDLDSYAFLTQRLRERACGSLFSSKQHTMRLIDKIIRWIKKKVPGMHWITAHGLRVGGYYELRQVAPNNDNVRLLQAGWCSQGEGRHVQAQMASSSSKYLRHDIEFVTALLKAGRRHSTGR